MCRECAVFFRFGVVYVFFSLLFTFRNQRETYTSQSCDETRTRIDDSVSQSAFCLLLYEFLCIRRVHSVVFDIFTLIFVVF